MLSSRLLFTFQIGCGRLLSVLFYLIVNVLLCLTYKGSIANGFAFVKWQKIDGLIKVNFHQVKQCQGLRA